MKRNITVKQILEQLNPYCIVVGSAAKGELYKDIDMVIFEKGLKLALKIFPPNWHSALVGNIKTFNTEVPIEVFTWCYGPDYNALRRRKDLAEVELFGIKMRAWANHEWEGKK